MAHEGVLDSIKLLSYKLLQREMGREGGGCHVNPAAILSKLDSMHMSEMGQLADRNCMAKDLHVYIWI